jgi:hypothetical protein
MLKYTITYSDGSSDGSNTREIECDWVNMPTTSNPMIEFRKDPNTLLLAVNPANIMSLELLQGTQVNDGTHVYDEADGPPTED